MSNKNLNSELDSLLSNTILPSDSEIKQETNLKKVSNGLKLYFGTAKNRFDNNIIKQSDGCWIYTKRWIIDDDGNQLLPKNYSAQIHKVKFPSGCVTNICGNKKCVNPKHLKDYPKEQQGLDAVANRKVISGDEHHQSKLSESDVKDIKKLFNKLLKERNGKHKGIASIIQKKYSYVSLARICQIIKK